MFVIISGLGFFQSHQQDQVHLIKAARNTS